MPRVLVTGANGFVGRHLCPELVRSGWDVRAVSRRPASTIPSQCETVLVSDIGRPLHWQPLLEDVQAVVHLVARTHKLQDHNGIAAYQELNVGGTRQLVRASIAAGVSRFLFMSSIKAVGEGASAAYSETTPCRPEDDYGQSKYDAERLLSEITAGTDLQTVILRSPLIYGAHVKGNFLRLLNAVWRGMPLPLGAIRNTRSMTYVGNLVSAIEVAMQHPAAAGETFHVADGSALSTRELIVRLAALMRTRALLFSVPPPWLRIVGQMARRSDQVRRVTDSLTVSTKRIQDRLQWQPPHSLESGLRIQVDWFLQQLSDNGQVRRAA